jgi:hypothetical protein
MAISIDLPAPLEEELEMEAEREGVTVSEQATFWLQLMTSLTRDGRKTPFRTVVQAYLRQNSLDAERLADVFEGLMALCLHESAQQPLPIGDGNDVKSLLIDSNTILSLLRHWRSPINHRSIEDDADLIVHELPPLGDLIQQNGRKNRISCLGKYSHIKLNTEDIMAERRRETEREDRPR